MLRDLGNTHFLPNFFFRPVLPSSGAFKGSTSSRGQDLKENGICFLLIIADSQHKNCHVEVGMESREDPETREGPRRISSNNLLICP